MGRMATDVGGTFTDLVHFDAESGDVFITKALTTPADPSGGVIDAIRLSELPPADVSYFAHGGTTVINAITERKGVKTALVTTAGFRDVLEIGRGNRPDLYNLTFLSPVPFVPRALRFEVRERVTAEGDVLEPLNRDDVAAVAEALKAEGVEAAAVMFLHSFAFPEHEAQCAALLRELLPDLAVTASHEVTREWREYERTNTAVLNACVQPIVERYFTKLEGRLSEIGLDCPLLAMQSNGGTTAFAQARAHPITLIESGPAGGVIGAAIVGRAVNEPNVISLDIGGTTAKCSLIEDGAPKVTTEYHLERTRAFPGFPVKVPVIDIVEIGAGGGSIAWFAEGGRLRVGPVSAGADPGPACYGRGGTDPTVTDAMCLAGVLDPEQFAEGRLTLRPDLAEAAYAPLAEQLGTDVAAAARAAVRIAEASMIDALKIVSVQRGYDPRDFVLVASGGGGPMHAARLGRELNVRETLIPAHPGVFSAWGMLATAPRLDLVRTRFMPAADTGQDAVATIFEEMKAEARAYFAGLQGVDPDALTFATDLEMRYEGQEHSVRFPTDLGRDGREAVLEAFHTAHERAFTFRLDDTPVEFVHFHLTAEAQVLRPDLAPLDGTGLDAAKARIGTRKVDFGEDGVADTAVFLRRLLPPGFEAAGPALVEEASSTTMVLPGQRLRVDDYGFLRISEG
ncbi:hydantoinase/oxoprolinase family protein [Marinibaculum pumilum]|uniref:Hydantoinase/oxoprolinase family protein n=1 Tax=Marinibaculum pumilum TaxID=1766165 RepID=A0ABV7KVJ7_9PROT